MTSHRALRRTGPLAALLALTAFGALCGCNKPRSRGVDPSGGAQLTDEERGLVVAKIGDRVITLADFERRLVAQSPFARSRYSSLERKRELLDSMVRFELLAMEAEARGYGEHPDVVLARKQAMVRLLTGNEIQELVKMDDITEADIKAWFDEHPSEYDKPPEVRAGHVQVADEGRARALHAEISAAIAADPLRARELFADFAKQHSEDAMTRARGGDLDYFGVPGQGRVERPPMLPEVPGPIAQAAAALDKPGELAPAPIQTSAGWHLVQKTGQRRAYRRSLDDVRVSIRNKLFRAKKAAGLEDYVQGLRERAGVTIDERVLDTVKPPPDPPGGFPSIAPPRFGPDGRMLPPGEGEPAERVFDPRGGE